MLQEFEYPMESDVEANRLDVKTVERDVEKQAVWGGLKIGDRIADICCGSGKTTSILFNLASPGGSAVGIDASEKRIAYAKEHYAADGIEFKVRNVKESLEDLGLFDFVWIRLALEYFKAEAFDVVQNASRIVRPGGILCLIDLDNNSLNHYCPPPRLGRTLHELSRKAEEMANFDPYAGAKLFSHLQRLGYEDIDVDVRAHHLIIGELKERDRYNWQIKIQMAAEGLHYDFKEYPGGAAEFISEFFTFFSRPERFTYTPLIMCKGRRPIR